MINDSQKLLQYNIDLHVWLRVTLSNHYIPDRMHIGPPASQCYCSSYDFALKRWYECIGTSKEASKHQNEQHGDEITFVYQQCINLETSNMIRLPIHYIRHDMLSKGSPAPEEVLNHCVNGLTNGEIMIWCCEWKKGTVNSAVYFLRRDFKEILSNPWFSGGSWSNVSLASYTIEIGWANDAETNRFITTFQRNLSTLRLHL